MSARLIAAASSTRWLASVAVLVVALRFALVTWGASGAATPPAPSAASPVVVGPTLGASGQAIVSNPTPTRRGPTKSTRLSVLVRPDRAKVRVDGAERGATPYVGDIECAPGETVVIEVEATGGKAQRFERPCGPDPIRVE